MAEELMTEQEIHLFGLQVLIQFLEGKGYEIEFAQPDKASLPHVVAKWVTKSLLLLQQLMYTPTREK